MIGILIVGDGLLGNMLLVGYRDFIKSESVGRGIGRSGLVWFVLWRDHDILRATFVL